MATATKDRKNKMNGANDPSNDAEGTIVSGEPYRVEVTIQGVCPILFHRYSCESVEAKAKAGKNTKAKKTDDIDSYVYRNEKGEICIPGEYLKGACVQAGRSRQDPRSPRKSAMDLYKAIVIPLSDLASLGTDQWDYLDKRRVVVQRSAISRVRPAFQAGWEATFQFLIQSPEYLDPSSFNALLTDAGRFVGVGDFRPTFGRFVVTSFGVLGD